MRNLSDILWILTFSQLATTGCQPEHGGREAKGENNE